MKKRSYKRDLIILISCFIVSRVIIKSAGVSFGYGALLEYWQYLDITSLKTNLLQSLWYQHSQPPLFNLLLGIVLKVSGDHSSIVIEFLLLLISLINGLLLLIILRRIISNSNLPLILSLLYLASPATMLFENELFYTTFISLLLLSSAYFMIQLTRDQGWKTISGMFLAFSLLCLTRSMYHLLWIIFISGILLFMYYGTKGFKKMLLASVISISLVAGWYVKNYVVFHNFSASSWVGINFSRIVFHDRNITDSSTIASIHPFMPISYYQHYISADYKKKYAGLNDEILLKETKNGRFINMNNAGYLEVSKKYSDAGIKEVKIHPFAYLKNVVTSFVIFFTPASSYFKVAANDEILKYYDTIYSLNPAHFFTGSRAKKQSLVLAAIPKFLLYFFTIFVIIRSGIRSATFSFLNVFIITTILFSLSVSSLLDYGENMRFRYEVEPLFLILLAQVILYFRQGKKANFE